MTIFAERRAGPAAAPRAVVAARVEEPPGGEGPDVRTAAAEVFTGWEALLAESLRQHGAGPARAEHLDIPAIAATEVAAAWG
jgi:hypothetical protein